MKKYLKYKDFIPIEFVEKKQFKEREENRRGYKIILLLNIILLLFNMENISKKSDGNEYADEPKKIYIEKEEIFKWINLYDENSIEFKVIDNVAEITYEKNKDINELEKLGAQIKKVTTYDDTKVVKVIYWGI